MEQNNSKLQGSTLFYSVFWFILHPLVVSSDFWNWLVAPLYNKPSIHKLINAPLLTFFLVGSINIALQTGDVGYPLTITAGIIASLIWAFGAFMVLMGKKDEKTYPLDQYFLSTVIGPFWLMVLLTIFHYGG